MTVTDLGEHALLSRILARLPPQGGHILAGPGDDAAVIAQDRNTRLVVTTDALVEDVHFRRAWSRPEDIGHKALAVNLSDLAAMGATPRWALLSLALPGALPVDEVERLVEGLARLAAAHGVSVAGGNITRSPGPLVVDVTAGGDVAPRRWMTRSGGRPGDVLWLSGEVGGARAGLEMCRDGQGDEATLARYLRPEPRVRLGIAIARTRAARAAMDLSDGLGDAVGQLAAASGCGARVNAAMLPVAPMARRWWQDRGRDPVVEAIEGGDDYELLVAAPARAAGRMRHVRSRVSAPPMTPIGVLTRTEGVWLEIDGVDRPWPRGYEHFRA